MSTIQNLQTQADAVKNETRPKANTANRIGSLFRNIIDTFLGYFIPKTGTAANAPVTGNIVFDADTSSVGIADKAGNYLSFKADNSGIEMSAEKITFQDPVTDEKMFEIDSQEGIYFFRDAYFDNITGNGHTSFSGGSFDGQVNFNEPVKFAPQDLAIFGGTPSVDDIGKLAYFEDENNSVFAVCVRIDGNEKAEWMPLAKAKW
jgi:hypothetical protein